MLDSEACCCFCFPLAFRLAPWCLPLADAVGFGAESRADENGDAAVNEVLDAGEERPAAAVPSDEHDG